MKANPMLPLTLLAGATILLTVSWEDPNAPTESSATPTQLAPTAHGERPIVQRLIVEIQHQSLEMYALDSDEIVRGLVTGTRPVFPSTGIPYTAIDLHVLSALKGGPRATIEVRIGGAESPSRVVDVVGAPRLVEGEEVLLFLMKYSDPETHQDYRGIRGLGDGAYRMPLLPQSGPKVIGLHTTGEATLVEFESRVKTLLRRLETR